ncbi:carbohydrate ABC transporter permease [Bacillus sp. Marseille-P3661]|uniref:carbohydrate ABC transporter permease n=1 Tax=Bacillus sp. Marseille-P3661 TaxID=1936234 RepID=UPI0015E1ABC0|nr:carbohydrate ABC transporter permease [Bacillus sp. Marseille-P3661]
MTKTSRLPYIFLFFLVALIFVPQLLTLSASFKEISEMYSNPLRIIPENPTLEPWVRLFSEQPVMKWLFNSIFIALIGTAINLVICSLGGYAFARLKFKGKEALFRLVIMTLMLPLAVYIVPLYIVMDKLSILNTYWAVAIPVSESIFGVFLLTQFFKNIPGEMEEAALIDGCNRFQTFLYIFLPMAKSSLFTLAIFSFVWKWNMFLWALIALNKVDLYPLILGLSLSVGQYETDKNVLMAGAILIAIPVLIIYFVFQKYIIGGEATSGLK